LHTISHCSSGIVDLEHEVFCRLLFRADSCYSV